MEFLGIGCLGWYTRRHRDAGRPPESGRVAPADTTPGVDAGGYSPVDVFDASTPYR